VKEGTRRPTLLYKRGLRYKKLVMMEKIPYLTSPPSTINGWATLQRIKNNFSIKDVFLKDTRKVIYQRQLKEASFHLSTNQMRTLKTQTLKVYSLKALIK